MTPMTAPPAVQSRASLPSLAGSYHIVSKGETVWRIARSYGMSPEALLSANRLSHATPLAVGQRLFIPLPQESRQFLWPVRGRVKNAGAPYGIEIAAPPGTLVRVSRSGRVAVAARDLSGWGKTVIVDHWDGYLSVYAGLEQLLVAPGSTLRQGVPLGSIGVQPLYFEVRYGSKPRQTLSLLPVE